MELQNYRVVLVSPLYSGNVGSVARLAGNFGLADVVLVNPQCDWLDDEAQKYACRLAQDTLRGFRVASSVAEALVGCTSAVAFTRRIGDMRQPDTPVGSIPGLQAEGKVALVFGREDSGLTHDEVLQCTHICTLPAAAGAGSLNLSHAICIVLFKMFEAATEGVDGWWTGDTTEPQLQERPALIEETNALFDHWRETMVAAGLVKAGNPDRMLGHIRKLIARARITTREVNMLRGFLSKVQLHMGVFQARDAMKTPDDLDT